MVYRTSGWHLDDLASPDIPQVVSGEPIPFEVGGRTFYIRQPRTDEIDESSFVQDVVRATALQREEVEYFKTFPCSEDCRQSFEEEIKILDLLFRRLDPKSETTRRQAISQRIVALQTRLSKYTRADEFADGYAALCRDRYLAFVLLCDSEGRQMFTDPSNSDQVTVWEMIPLPIKDAARPAIWRALRLIEDLPFVSETPPDSDSQSTSD